jgi:hypothetical protein
MVVTYVDVGFAALGVYFLKRLLAPREPAPFPPGPKGLPLVGNAADMPAEHEWKTFSSWADQYGQSMNLKPISKNANPKFTGDIIGVKILGQPMIILNSADHAFAMLVRLVHPVSTAGTDRSRIGQEELDLF